MQSAAVFMAIMMLCLPAQAASGGKPPERDVIINSQGFLAGHPDLRWRAEGMHAHEAGNSILAMTYFRRAAYFADKPSQAMVAELLWTGAGVKQKDPVAAYIWMDLAAERHYQPFLLKREAYWAALDSQQRERALKDGLKIYAEYGDAVAKPRLEARLRRGAAKATGSRLGSVGALRVVLPGPGGSWVEIPASHYYAPVYWEPAQYWKWQDRLWKAPPKGKVDIGPMDRLPVTKP